MKHNPRRRDGTFRPSAEGLEARQLLYGPAFNPLAAVGPITYSFLPDGTDLAVIPSNLTSGFEAEGISSEAFRAAFRQAASVWESATGLQLVEVPDLGLPLGTPGADHDDPRFGDIRIGGMTLPSYQLAATFVSPGVDVTGSTLAGSIVFNTSADFSLQQTPGSAQGVKVAPIDLETVALHEIGHALGLGELMQGGNILSENYGGAVRGLGNEDLLALQAATQEGVLNLNTPADMTTRAILIAPGSTANFELRVPTPGFYQIGLSEEWGQVSVTMFGGTQTVAPDLHVTALMYLDAGVFPVRITALGASRAALSVNLGTQPIENQSLPNNGVGQGASGLQLVRMDSIAPSTSGPASRDSGLTATLPGPPNGPSGRDSRPPAVQSLYAGSGGPVLGIGSFVVDAAIVDRAGRDREPSWRIWPLFPGASTDLADLEAVLPTDADEGDGPRAPGKSATVALGDDGSLGLSRSAAGEFSGTDLEPGLLDLLILGVRDRLGLAHGPASDDDDLIAASGPATGAGAESPRVESASLGGSGLGAVFATIAVVAGGKWRQWRRRGRRFAARFTGGNPGSSSRGWRAARRPDRRF